jgi:hemerythrin-like domain-containing protein
MEVNRQLGKVRSEHDEILQFLITWKSALERAASHDWDVRCHGLEQLHEMDGEIAEICEHCRREEEEIESPFLLYLEPKSLKELRKEHRRLRSVIGDFRGELKRVTASRTADLIALGSNAIEEIRKHVAEEEALLTEIEAGAAAEEKVLLQYTQSPE